MKGQIILIAGIKRSFSTGQFNLVRLALEMAGYTVNIHGHSYTPRTVPEGEVDLVKRHKFSEEIAESADHIFLTDRKDSEIRASLTRFNGNEPYEGRIADMRAHLDKWIDYAGVDNIFPYSLWQNHPDIYTELITLRLGTFKVGVDELLEAFNEIEPPESGQDPQTLLFSNHITSK